MTKRFFHQQIIWVRRDVTVCAKSNVTNSAGANEH
jgi:hypothetical protein